MDSVERARDELLSTGISPEVLADIVRDSRQAIHHPQFIAQLRREMIENGTDEAKADRLVDAFATLIRAAG